MPRVEREHPQAASFEELLAPLLDRAYGLACHLTRSRDEAEDLVQEAALQAFSHFDQFQPGTNFKAWYLRILTNCFLMRYRRRRREPEILNLEDAEPLFLNLRSHEFGLVGPPEDPAAAGLSSSFADFLGREREADRTANFPDNAFEVGKDFQRIEQGGSPWLLYHPSWSCCNRWLG